MNSWSTKTDYSLFHLELDPSHYGQWSEMSTAECMSDYWFTRYVTSFLNSIKFSKRGIFCKVYQGSNNQPWLTSCRIG